MGLPCLGMSALSLSLAALAMVLSRFDSMDRASGRVGTSASGVCWVPLGNVVACVSIFIHRLNGGDLVRLTQHSLVTSPSSGTMDRLDTVDLTSPFGA